MDQDLAAERIAPRRAGESLIPHSQTMVGLARIVHCDALNLGRPSDSRLRWCRAACRLPQWKVYGAS